MKRTIPTIPTILALALVAMMAAPALAGHDGYAKCKESTQTCLDHMAAKMKSRGWLGIEMDDSKGPSAIAISRVVPGSPAQAAGFQQGDQLVSVNGARFAENTEEKCATCSATAEKWVPGAEVTYVVNRGGMDVTLKATLAALPSDVLAQWVGQHMLEHAAAEEIAKK